MIFNAAAEVSETNPNCNIADSVAYIANIKCFPAVTYQKILSEINNDLYDEGFKDVWVRKLYSRLMIKV
ncbi:MAG: hypothetical protein IMY69_07165 [Bacteroidetes bacterium]|nr:hypothetical protein [Bacteroidota bacterium]